MQPVPPGQVSAQEEARLLEIRKNAVKKIRMLAAVMTLIASLSIVTGIALLSGIKGGGWPLVSGSPIWSGIIVLSGAICGLVLGKTNSEWTSPDERAKQRCLFVGFYAIAVTSFSFCGLSIGYTVWGIVACSGKDIQTCGHHHRYEVVANSIAVFLCVVLIVTCIIACVMFCYYRHAFKFFSYNDRIEQMQGLIYQQQAQITSLNNSQGPQQTVYGTNWPSAPPPYSEKLNV